MRYSVIIPVYNAESTLQRCIDSLLLQNYADCEIILVNDGSADNSGIICEEYSRNHSNILYISQKNGGVSAARNAGLDKAQGEFILFVDSDDYVTEDFFILIDRTVKEENADFIQFSYCFDNGTDRKLCIRNKLSIHSRKELIPHIADAICRKIINGCPAKLFRREIIDAHSIRFPLSSSIAEDRAFNIVYSFYINSYAVSEDVVYVINTENEDSLSRKQHSDLKKSFDIAAGYISREFASASINEDERELYQRAFNFSKLREVYHSSKLLIKNGARWTDRQKQLNQQCREINGMHLQYPKTRYCKKLTIPVKLRLTMLIDAMMLIESKR